VLSGIKKSMILFITTKTGHSSIHLSSSIAWRASRSWTRRKPNNSRKRWTIGRKMQASKPKRPLFKARPLNQQGQLSQMASLTIVSDLEICCMARDPLPLRKCPHSNRRLSFLLANPRSWSTRRSVLTVIDLLRWTPWIRPGEEYWASCLRWALLRTK